jgi:hypothetical protein
VGLLAIEGRLLSVGVVVLYRPIRRFWLNRILVGMALATSLLLAANRLLLIRIFACAWYF